MIEIQGTAILRDGENIGAIEGDTAFLGKKPGPAILGQIRKAAGKPDLAFEYRTFTVAELDAVKTKVEHISEAQSVAPDVPTQKVAQQQSPSEKTGLERLLDPCEAGKIPAPPPLNPAAGDKCPLFREWFKTHATPEEYAAKYPATRKLPSSLDQLKAKRRQIAGEVPDTAD